MHIHAHSCELRGQDLNLRPSGYEPDELPDCSIPRYILLKPKADDRTRTDNLLITNQLLCQLSHIGTSLWLKRCIFYILVDGEGFEPSKASPTDLQSAPFGHSGIHPFCLSGTNRARTYDPLLVRQMLSQLSYDPI